MRTRRGFRSFWPGGGKGPAGGDYAGSGEGPDAALATLAAAPTELPNDRAALQAMLRAALAEIERLQFQLAGLKRNRFGRRSEKLDDETLQRATEDLEQSVAEKMAAL
jgi:hypothetical protein